MEVVLIAHNIRSTHNFGSILRTADGFGAALVVASGYTPYPTLPGDLRLPHIRDKLTAQIHKTALGAETSVPVEHTDDLPATLAKLKAAGYQILALEQAPGSVRLGEFKPAGAHLALILGPEVEGLSPDILALCDTIIEIPMRGQKESFNVSVAAGIALYEISGRAMYTQA